MALSWAQDALAVASGGAVGFSLGLIGGGGSTLAVPLLLYVVGIDDAHGPSSRTLRFIMTAHLSGAWNFPTRVLTGAGRIKELPDIANCHGRADASAIGWAPGRDFRGREEQPDRGQFIAGLAVFRAGRHDGVVAIGGGSALDVGKCVAFMVAQERPVWDFEDVDDRWKRTRTEGVAPVIAVPLPHPRPSGSWHGRRDDREMNVLSSTRSRTRLRARSCCRSAC
jgi:Iron-containing alcohol dehydrogenase